MMESCDFDEETGEIENRDSEACLDISEQIVEFKSQELAGEESDFIASAIKVA